MYLLLILSCVFTISVILLLNIKDPLQQVFVFLITLIVFMGFNFLFGDIKIKQPNLTVTQLYNDSLPPQDLQVQNAVQEEQVEEDEENIEIGLQEKILNRLKIDRDKNVNYLLNPLNSDEYDPAYTPDKIIPNCSYNIGDCTNDMSCIIPPDNANLFGPITPEVNTLARTKNTYPERKCKILPKITIDRTKHCSNCGGILQSAKKIKNNCSDIEKVVNNYDRLCIHCKVGVRMNSQCFNSRDLPLEYYPI